MVSIELCFVLASIDVYQAWGCLKIAVPASYSLGSVQGTPLPAHPKIRRVYS